MPADTNIIPLIMINIAKLIKKYLWVGVIVVAI